MRHLLTITLIVAVIFVAYFLTRPKANAPLSAPEGVESPVPLENDALTLYRDESLGLSFTYPSGDAGYVVRDPRIAEREAEKTIVLVHAADAAVYDTPAADGELPPTLSIVVYDNASKQFPGAWAESHTAQSGYGQKIGDAEDLVVGGANAIRYAADGLYRASVTVIAHGSRIYVVRGEYLDEASPIYRDYESLLDSITFVPAPGEF
ncbi:MAG TPA: hypothetical protein VFS75_03585 [Candidatus Paceibacterota bacterium]|nr:hypothetical protein [Candidatus Paceibacterota bacterium]